jgi:glucose/arabinose dehydrogenase
LPYNIPPDNPFLNSGSALEEIWAYGLRNPWRFSFDRLTGDLYIADVGQWSYEEVNFQSGSSSGGENYGWPIMEGMHCVGSSCDQSRFMLPITEYGRDDGCSITGGYVYRGRAIPDLYGAYIFSDYCSGILWTAYQTENGNWQAVIVGQVASPSTFGEDENGELYVTDHANGVLYSLTRP